MTTASMSPRISEALTPPSEFLTKKSMKQNEKNQQIDCSESNIMTPLSPPCSPTACSPNEFKNRVNIGNLIEVVKEDQNEDDEIQRQNERKIDEILSCLNGIFIPQDASQKSSRDKKDDTDDDTDDERVVNLWHLRQLAISRHGLVSATIRKRAWPKLVGANEHILNTSIASLPSHFSRRELDEKNKKPIQVNNLAESDIAMIKRDIMNCIWNIEEEIKSVRKQKDKQKETIHDSGIDMIIKKGKPIEESSAASLDSGCSAIIAGRITPQLIPEATRAFPRFGSGTSVTSNTSGASTPMSGIGSPNVPSIAPLAARNGRINENSDVPSVIRKTKSKPRSRRKKEHALLFNIITSVLRTMPEEEASPLEEEQNVDCDDETVATDNIKRLYYFEGMHNVIGPLLITLESPSLTSLIFNRLAQSHLHDAMESTFENIQAGIRLILMPLLKEVDGSLHDYIVKGGIKDPCTFALPWVLCWFTNNISDYNIVGRLFDVFIASHASCPVYLSVAMLTHPTNKRRIMQTPCEKSTLTSVLCSLPSFTACESNAMNSFEAIIEVALSYMRSNPIQLLLNISNPPENDIITKSSKLARSVKMLKRPPSWAYIATASTDWTLIKQAKVLRGLSPTSRLRRRKALSTKKRKSDCLDVGPFMYDLALDASGLTQKYKDSIRNPKRRSKIIVQMFFLLIVVVVAISMGIPKNEQLVVVKDTSKIVEIKYEVDNQEEVPKVVQDINIVKNVSEENIQVEAEAKSQPLILSNGITNDTHIEMQTMEILQKVMIYVVMKYSIPFIAKMKYKGHDDTDNRSDILKETNLKFNQDFKNEQFLRKGFTTTVERMQEYLQRDSYLFFIYE